MEASVISVRSSTPRCLTEKGFSFIELLFVAFILGIGILGLTLLQVMSMRSATGSKALNTAVMVGEGTLESIQAEGRERMLFLKYSGSAPITTYFTVSNDSITRYFDFKGNPLTGAADSYFTMIITPSDIVAISSAGGTKLFTLTVTFYEAQNPQNPTLKIPRTVTLTRQVAYA